MSLFNMAMCCHNSIVNKSRDGMGPIQIIHILDVNKNKSLVKHNHFVLNALFVIVALHHEL